MRIKIFIEENSMKIINMGKECICIIMEINMKEILHTIEDADMEYWGWRMEIFMMVNGRIH